VPERGVGRVDLARHARRVRVGPRERVGHAEGEATSALPAPYTSRR
jgi:hypothetical protein